MARNDEASTQRNHQAVGSFVEFWKKKAAPVSAASRMEFLARIRYQWLTNDLRAKRNVFITLSGFKSHDIEIQEGGWFSVDTLHLGFTCDFGRIRFLKRTHALVIKGNSPKLGGNYRVRIKPVRNQAK